MKARGTTHQYACFHCRKSFKRPQLSTSNNRFMTAEQQRGQSKELELFEAVRQYKCPDCGAPTSFMGIDFKAPKKSDIRSWREVQAYIEGGGTYYRKRDS